MSVVDRFDKFLALLWLMIMVVRTHVYCGIFDMSDVSKEK